MTANQGQTSAIDQHPEAFFDAVDAAFERATKRAGLIEMSYRIAGLSVRQQFAGDALCKPLSAALAHLRSVSVDEPDLTVCTWDSESTGVAIPVFPWEHNNGIHTDDDRTQGEVPGFNTVRFGTLHEQWHQQFTLIDRERKRAICWYRLAKLPWWESAFPMRAALHLWSRDTPLQLIHSSSVGTADGAVLIAGRSGAGKSTTALTCLDAGMLYLGDDYTAVYVTEHPRVYTLYAVAKLEDDNIHRFPNLERYIGNPNRESSEKAIIFLPSVYAPQLVETLPLKAIFLPRVTGQPDTHLRTATPIAALTALAPTTMFQLIGSKLVTHEKLNRLVRIVPSYHLEVGTDLQQIPDVIATFLKTQS